MPIGRLSKIAAGIIFVVAALGGTAPVRPVPARPAFRQVGIDKAIVAGQSLGGRVGQVFAAVYHAEIQGLGLVGGPHTSNFFPTREEATKVLNASHRMLESQTEFASREAAFAYLRALRPRDKESALRHRLEHNFIATTGGVAAKYDKVR